MPRKLSTPVLAAAALFALGAAVPPHARSAAAEYCQLDYARGDNMWAGTADAQKSLGWESVRLDVGQKRVFITDWKYEKMRNDGNNYYGSHLRTAKNVGTRALRLTLQTQFGFSSRYIDPGKYSNFTADLAEVYCP